MSQQRFTVSGLNQHVKYLLEADIGRVTVVGEISNFKHHSSGHMYFSLKDERAELSASCFRNVNQRLNFSPQNGLLVEATGLVTLYPARGQFQIVIQSMKPAGDGLLQQRFEALKAKLLQEGLFDSARKQALPPQPKRIGIITSPTGAVIRDIRSVLKRRAPWVELIIYPCAVQGEQAKHELAHSLEVANLRHECDLLIIARGGGSLEDLWPFNEEIVARAIAQSQLPVISAVGHQTDVTIADFVADMRAATPSEAAEKAAPDAELLRTKLNQQQRRLQFSCQQTLNRCKQQLNAEQRRLRSPQSLIADAQQKLDQKTNQLERQLKHELALKRSQIQQLHTAINSQSPFRQLKQAQQQLNQQQQQLERSMLWRHQQAQQRVERLNERLNLVNPKRILTSGYSITLDESGRPIKASSEVSSGSRLKTLLADGEVNSTAD